VGLRPTPQLKVQIDRGPRRGHTSSEKGVELPILPSTLQDMLPTPRFDPASRGDALDLRRALGQPRTIGIFSHEFATRRGIEKLLPSKTIKLMEHVGIVEDYGTSLRLPFQFRWIDNHVVFTDRVTRAWKRDKYRLDPLWEGPGLSKLLVRRPVSRALDVGCGCGVLSLSAATYAERVVGADINPRAIHMSRFNATLNGVANIDFLESDLFNALGNQQFGHIISNFPGYFAIKTRSMIGSGENLMARFLSLLPAHLPKDAHAQINVAVLERGGASFLDLLGDWMGNDLHEFRILLLELFRANARQPKYLPILLWRALKDGAQLLRVTEFFRGWMTMRRGQGGAFRIPLPYHQVLAPLGRDFGSAVITWLLDNAARIALRKHHEHDWALAAEIPDFFCALEYSQQRSARVTLAKILRQLETMPTSRANRSTTAQDMPGR
jgi:SAM-dependent methyltransferase